MKPENLQFYKTVEGRKPHHIFTQEDKFYVFADLDNETRGNFLIVDDNEVEKIKNRIIARHLRDFHPRHSDICNYETDREYREHRIRTICYILQAQGFLFQHDWGREIIFERFQENISSIVSPTRNKVVKIRSSGEVERKQKLNGSKLNKIKKATRIVGFYVDEYWEKKKKDLIDRDNSSVFICAFCKFQRKLSSKTASIPTCPRCNQKAN